MSIKVENLSKRYAGTVAIDRISFDVTPGEIVGFLGPNGAGKSTLMRILTTYLKPDEGKAWVNGFEVQNEPREVQKSIGYLPENNPLYLDLYVREYLRFCGRIHGVPKSHVENVVIRTGLAPEARKKIGQLSKGYRQRVGLAAALLHTPKVLILDEPTTGLDPNQLIEIRELIRSLAKEHTVFLSTHILQEVDAVCDRVIIINKGNLVADKRMDKIESTGKQTIEVEFDYRVEDVLLANLPQVVAVRNTRDMIYELDFMAERDMRSAVFDFAHDHELKILSLQRRNKGLEELFRESTVTKTHLAE